MVLIRAWHFQASPADHGRMGADPSTQVCFIHWSFRGRLHYNISSHLSVTFASWLKQHTNPQSSSLFFWFTDITSGENWSQSIFLFLLLVLVKTFIHWAPPTGYTKHHMYLVSDASPQDSPFYRWGHWDSETWSHLSRQEPFWAQSLSTTSWLGTGGAYLRGVFASLSSWSHASPLNSAAVVKNPPNNLWIIAAVLAPIAVVTVIIIIITAVLCRKNKNDFKPDTMMNLPQRAKVCVASREERARNPGPRGLCLPFGHWGHCKYLQKPPLQSSSWRRPFGYLFECLKNCGKIYIT